MKAQQKINFKTDQNTAGDMQQNYYSVLLCDAPKLNVPEHVLLRCQQSSF
jgi:hypothetical protein